MLYIIRSDETLEELPDATQADLEGEILVCREASGKLSKTYGKLEVLMYGTDARIKSYAKDLNMAERERSSCIRALAYGTSCG